jgi:PKD repeat protein
VSYQWSFGDGSSGSGSSVTHTFSSSATYQVTLTVTDNQNASDSQTRPVHVNDIFLNANGSKYRGKKEAALDWSGATTSQVQIIRDGRVIATPASSVNGASYIDKSVANKIKSAQYQVCESDGNACSDVVNVRF